MALTPAPCNCGGGDTAGADVENLFVCDVLVDGTIAGTALAVYEYDEAGVPTGPPTFVDPVTGAPYVAEGTLQPCPSNVPAVLAQVCLANGHAGAILRSPDGSLQKLDAVTGLAFVDADLVVCPEAESVDVLAQVCLANGHAGTILRNPDGTFENVDAVTGLAFLDADIVTCPEADVLAQVCLANGHAGVIIRKADGTLEKLDAVTGLAFVDANIVACPVQAPAAVTLSAQAKLLGAAASWTPGGDVVGTLTSVTFTVLTGTVTLTDADGTVSAALPAGTSLAWGTEDRDALTGPQSITTAAASSAIVGWTQR